MSGGIGTQRVMATPRAEQARRRRSHTVQLTSPDIPEVILWPHQIPWYAVSDGWPAEGE